MAVSFETAPQGPLRRVISSKDEERRYLPILSLACTSGAATRAEDTVGIRRADQMHPVLHHFSAYVRATTVSVYPGICHVFYFCSPTFFVSRIFSYVVTVLRFLFPFSSIHFFPLQILLFFFFWRLLN